MLAFVVVAAALTHVLMVGYYVNEPLEIALWLWMSVVFVGLVLWVRVVRPLELRGKAWRVEDVVPERGGIHTVVLEPSRLRARKFDGFRFQPGSLPGSPSANRPSRSPATRSRSPRAPRRPIGWP